MKNQMLWLIGAALLAWSCASAPAPVPSAPANLLPAGDSTPDASAWQTRDATLSKNADGLLVAVQAHGALTEGGLSLSKKTVYEVVLETSAQARVALDVQVATAEGADLLAGDGGVILPSGRTVTRLRFATAGDDVSAALSLGSPADASFTLIGTRLILVGPVLADRTGKDATTWVENPLRPHLPDLTGRGAALPFLTYQAEDMVHTGKLVGPSRRTLDTGTDLAAEASGREAVDLTASGDYVEFITREKANSLVIRFALPDAGGGKGLKAPVALSVDGVYRQDVLLSSENVVVYGDFPWKNDPSLGTPRHFFDEVRLLVKDIPAGAKVRLQRPGANGAKYCVIDLVDAEWVAPPLAQPAGFLSIADFGAVPGDGKADNTAIEACIAAAKKQKAAGVWFPAGTWDLPEELYPDLVIRGAGMWYTNLKIKDIAFQGINKTFEVHDLAILGSTKERDDSIPSAGLQGVVGKGSVLENVWMVHTKVGVWTERGTDGLTIRGCRIRDTLADGINLYRGTKNSVVENNHFRGTGDDSIALWSATIASNTQPDEGNIIRNNTIQAPWLANGIAVYGGKDNLIENNVVEDTGLNGAGIDISSRFEPIAFSGTLTIRDNVLIRCGSLEGDGGWHGAVWIDGRDKGIPGAVRITGLQIFDATVNGITVQGPGKVVDTTFDGVLINGASGWAVKAYDDAAGSLKFSNTVVKNALSGGLKNRSSMDISQGEGNSGL